MLWLLIIKGVALGYATKDALRARFWLGLGFLGAMAYLMAALGSALLDTSPVLPLGPVLVEHWSWLFLGVMPPLSFAPMAIAWRRVRHAQADDPASPALDRAALAFLANGLLDTALLVIGLFATWLVHRDGF